MSKIENPKIVLKKTLFFKVSEHNALNFKILMQKSVTIKFTYFYKKGFRRKIYSIHMIYIEWKLRRNPPPNITVIFVMLNALKK